MATAQSAMTGAGRQSASGGEALTGRDAAESMLKTVDDSTKGATGVSLFHILTFGSIGASIALYLVGKNGNMPRQHWSAAGFADTDPIANNATKDGQAKNRRCEIIVVPDVDEMIDLKEIAQ